ncbi:unnamed protein product [Arctia plantaginis]|uniref:Uncharacterized protein n=1 Tax=Arctia plantaginis TaxID=874455 RepID=A0A8S0ZBI9_ARCPL|nr:unnamed protein product [Arctia plantaginis]CAB3234328.1 unnamed protein product [Arctia plantaginis]
MANHLQADPNLVHAGTYFPFEGTHGSMNMNVCYVTLTPYQKVYSQLFDKGNFRLPNSVWRAHLSRWARAAAPPAFCEPSTITPVVYQVLINCLDFKYL